MTITVLVRTAAVLTFLSGTATSCSSNGETSKSLENSVSVVAVDSTVAEKTSLMPNVICMNLQSAQDLIQTTGVFFSNSEDATGQGRMQIFDRNWIVIAQRPEPGTPFGEGDAVLSVVKYGEPTGGVC